jgi:hypothetical protein
MIHPSKFLKFTGAEINTLQMRIDRHNENLEVLDSIKNYDTWKLVETKLEEEFRQIEKLTNEIYIKSEKRK